MSFYSNLAKTASRLLAKFGQTVTIKRIIGEVIDPVTGVITDPGVETFFYPKGIFKKFPDKLIDGTRIKAGDRILLLDNTVELLMTDVISINGEFWNIQDTETVSPAGIPLVYFPHVRR